MPKKQINMRLDEGLVEAAKRHGPNLTTFVEEAMRAQLPDAPKPPALEGSPAAADVDVREIAPTKPGEVSEITGERFPTKEESDERRRRVVARAAELDGNLPEVVRMRLAAAELYPRAPVAAQRMIREPADRERILAEFSAAR